MTDLSNPYDIPEFGAGGPEAAARLAALKAATEVEVEATPIVAYDSAGYVLIVGPERDALECAAVLRDRLHCTLFVTAPATGTLSGPALAAREDALRVEVLHGAPGTIEGHLGRFACTLRLADGKEVSPAALARPDRPWFDLVLDLRREPGIRLEIPPLGYHAPAGDSAQLQRMLAELPEMTGEFEKPRFFRFDSDLCAHGDSGLTGCTRCLDACPTGAIRSIGDLVDINPYICQGAGTCASVCPSGAITYAYPGPRDQMARIKRMLEAYRSAGGQAPWLLFHDDEAGLERLRAMAPDLPAQALPVQIDEIGSVGIDVWLTAFAHGASAIALLDTDAVAPSVRAAMHTQITYAKTLLDAMGYGGDRLAWLAPGQSVQAVLGAAQAPAVDEPARFDAPGEKRASVHRALSHLYAHAPERPAVASLPTGAPFGQVHVDRQACTLCMACPQVCPSHALTDGGEEPRLSFTEDRCVQCGLCAKACPEQAITLESRYLFDDAQRRAPRVVNEEEPFCCIRCGKPFATQRLIGRMTEKLQGHHMFQSEEALQRLKMCGDCRVVDLFAQDLQGGSKPRWLGPR